MANASFSLARGSVDNGPDAITVGTLAPNAGDVELRMSTANGLLREDAIILVTAFLRRLEDDRFNDLTSV